ncbi:glycosyltransferase family 92 protein RCOM_0530710 [Cajanus cajan]|uniref:Glycosyltransferase family 92 protein n=1 Tax=Cajanus cajan TaxID=3821 RepID=A0A151S3N0_CAJCA|nr:glycosyltransferase family 92 protein RCOM_0530710 [Cajanus cajan]KYP49341.1 hypothetical protein KK1_028883 [Cajanus cajan]
MDPSPPEQSRKRKHTLAPPTLISLFLYLSFSLFLFLFLNSSSHHSFSTPTPPPLHVHDRILFPDHVLLTLPNHHLLFPSHQLHCVYYNLFNSSSPPNPLFTLRFRPLISTDRYDKFHFIARCPLPGNNFSAVTLRWKDDHRPFRFPVKTIINSWDNLAYSATLDGDTAVVFVKGLNLKPHKASDANLIHCHFGPRNGAFWLTTKAVSAAQEVVRCSLPQSILKNPDMARGISVTVSHVRKNKSVPTVARIGGDGERIGEKEKEKFELCACTMVWNQARAMKEWVMYHAWVGVQRWFIYDNNSDDEIDDVARELDSKGYNVTRVVWPWIKSQEAGFSHCGLKAKEECKWVGFFDVDEFFYLGEGKKNALRSIVANFSPSKSVAELRIGCHNFGPSGLRSHPKQGVTVGYTCRLRSPERHKSIVRPDLLHVSLLNVVHHFELREGFEARKVAPYVAVVNHYKYQVWETFKAKFFRRVATYVVDWNEEVNIGSKDRAPGLGTQAIEPPDWPFKFCEVWDTRLKDFILSNFSDPKTGLLPWERSLQ